MVNSCDQDSEPACQSEYMAATEKLPDKSYSQLLQDMQDIVMAELKALPGEFAEIRESLILHVERRSLVVAGVVVAIGAALLLLGCLWIHWCHTEHTEYVPSFEEKEKQPHHAHKHHRHTITSTASSHSSHKEENKLTHRKTHMANGSQ